MGKPYRTSNLFVSFNNNPKTTSKETKKKEGEEEETNLETEPRKPDQPIAMHRPDSDPDPDRQN